MPNTSPWRRVRRMILAALVSLPLWALLGAGPAVAQQEDPPGRVGRIAELQGGVSWFDHEDGRWAEAERNRPLTSGDRLATRPGSRAEVRVGSTVLRLGGGSELEFVRLDDERLVLQLHAGALALRVRSRDLAEEVEVRTAELRLLPQRAGHYRFDRIDDTTWAGSWRGELLVEGPGGPIIAGGQRQSFIRDRGDILRSAAAMLPDDAFAGWVARDEQQEERSASTRYVSPEMTGAEDLDRYGRWTTHPEYGPLWMPLEVGADWAPYRYGRWAWVRPWGWTWIDEAPWGFAPFHYGRWLLWQGRWGWVPGAYVARPIYAPALVAWVGSGNLSLGVQIGGPPSGWIPLAPREVFRPYYRATPVYLERINPTPSYRWQHAPSYQPNGPLRYANPAVQRAQEVEPRQTWRQRPPGLPALQEPRAVEGPQRQPRREAGPPQGAQPPQGPAGPLQPSPVQPGRAPPGQMQPGQVQPGQIQPGRMPPGHAQPVQPVQPVPAAPAAPAVPRQPPVQRAPQEAPRPAVEGPRERAAERQPEQRGRDGVEGRQRRPDGRPDPRDRGERVERENQR